MAALLSALAAGTNLLQLAVVLLVRQRRWLTGLAFAQIVGDVVFAGFLVYVTGGSDSLFSFMYLLAIVNGSILLERRGAWMAAGASVLVDFSLVLGLQQRFLQPVEDGLAQTRLALPQLIQTLFTHAAAFALTGVLVSYVAGQLRREGERAQVAESSLLKLSALHDSIVRSIVSGILTTDERGRITFVNRAGLEIFLRPIEELAGRELEELFPQLGTALRDIRSRGEARRLECAWVAADGEVRILGFTITALSDEGGGQIGTIATFQDLTRYRELELRAARSERLAAVGKLAAGLAHELRNPLASVSGSVELLASGAARTAQERRLFDIVLREAERLNRLVTDFLAFARPAPPTPAPVDLPGLVEEVLGVFAADPQAAGLVRETHLEPATALVDAAQLKQVLWNLLLNAAQASPPGGVVRIDTGSGPEPGFVFVRVEDQGPGIPEEETGRIFDPFYTTKEKGTGLGLATVHRIVDAHGGQVGVESPPGQGARFTVLLPAARKEG